MKYEHHERVDVIQEYHNGFTVKQVCARHHLPKSTLYYWIHSFGKVESHSGNAVSMQEYVLMQRRLARVEMENQIFRESGCTATSPLREKIREIKRLRGRFSVHALCSVLQVRRSTFYYYLFRSPEVTLVAQQDSIYRKRIAAIFEESQQRFGARKIKVKLNQEGYQISERRILRLMHEMGLQCNREKPVRKYLPETARQYYRNRLNRNFNQIAPNQAWVGDITYCRVGGRQYYICVVIDLFSRRVVAHEISSVMSSSIVSATFLEAYIHRNQPQNLIFHSDMGTQYMSRTFQKRLDSLHVEQSFSRPGCPYDNAVAESFFASLKKEEIHRIPYESIGQLKEAVESYIDYFNTYRPHQSLGYLTPEQAEQSYFEQK